MSADTKNSRRGASCVHRNTHDIDSPKAQGEGPLGGDGSLESSQMVIAALLETVEAAQVMTANAVRYSQGAISRVAIAAVRVLFHPKHGYDHWAGTNDLAVSQLAERGGFSERQWRRVKKKLAELGIVSFVHRSVPSGLSDRPGVARHIQVSDLHWVSPDNLAPWLREIFDPILARMRRKAAARAQREGQPMKRTALVKRDRPHRRIPALLNPIGWARALAAEANPAATYAAQEERAVAFATQLALRGS